MANLRLKFHLNSAFFTPKMEDQNEEKPLLNNDGKETQLINATQTDQTLTDTMVVGGAPNEADGASIDSSCSSFTSRPIPQFLLKLFDMLSNDETKSFVAWSSTGTSFVINNSHAFAANVLPMYFRHNNFQSFITQLHTYGFRKISWEQWEYKNEYFQKGGRHLLRNIKRRNQIHQNVQPDSGLKLSLVVSPSNNKEFETSMEAYNLLKAEIVKLKEKQQVWDEQLASLKYQVARHERDQNRTMVAAQRIMSTLRESSNIATVSMMDDDSKTHMKGKWKLGEITMCSDDGPGSCSGASKVNVVAESNCEIALDEEEIGKHPERTLLSLEDMFGESECIEFIRELHEKNQSS